MAELYRYAAFISYSSKDARFAKRLHRTLESYGIPAALGEFDLIGEGKKNRIYPVFRDREELSAGELGGRIEAALKASANLIVVCSPNSAASPWVEKEIQFFIGIGRRDKVFAIITDDAPLVDETGADATASNFPPAFRGDALKGENVALEPLAADARKGKDGFRNAWLKLVAGMIGVTPGQIIDRDKRRRRKRQVGVAASALALFSAATIISASVVGSGWRSQLVEVSRDLAADGRTLDALPFVVGAAANSTNVLPVAGLGSAQALGARVEWGLIADLGPMQDQAILSKDGRYVASLPKDPNTTDLERRRQSRVWSVRDLQTGAIVSSVPAISSELFLEGLRNSLAGKGLGFDLKTPIELDNGDLKALSPNRQFAVFKRGNRYILLEVATKREVALGDVYSEEYESEFDFSGNSERLAYKLASGTGVVVDAVTGREFNIGSLHSQDRSPSLNWSGTRAAVLRPDLVGEVVDVEGSGTTSLGTLWVQPPKFSPRGTLITGWNSDRTAYIFDDDSKRRTDFADLGPLDIPPGFSPDGTYLILGRPDLSRLLYHVASRRRFELGIAVRPPTLSRRSERMAIWTGVYNGFVVDMDRLLSSADPGSRTSAFCASQSGTLLRPFPSDYRALIADQATGEEGRRRLRIHSFLRGRPWNPCDWRGLGAILPSAESGDGWFEGAQQWLRLIHVHYFGGKDWSCEETTSRASARVSAARAGSCRRFISPTAKPVRN
ncbi:MAG: toll/interleukin-1 receptor domain-containing protein [Alphaproteobacteria bacterium]|nr:toll/interleukin-1 receptor domain-containing protein [Alphaproteobacteria bacterium]